MKFWDIWNMTFGFLGIQFGLALQNANVSRILQTFGASTENLSLFWIAAPLTGMIVQPIIGHYSDRTWTKLGRRKPYFLIGAILAAISLILMPNSPMFAKYIPAVFIGAGILMIMDASINVAMEPFRALVADLLPSEQRTLGFSVQTFLIGIGAVLGAILPWFLSNVIGVSNQTVITEGADGFNSVTIAPNIRIAFYVGAAVLFLSVLWTILKTKEYPPREGEIEELKRSKLGLFEIFKDFGKMPGTMIQLGVVQFFSWFALFSMWVYMTPAVAQHIYGSVDPNSVEYAKAGDWVGVLQGVYNGVAAIIAFLLPVMAKKISRKGTHSLSLLLGALGFASFFIIKDPDLLIFSMIGIGIAWGSILAMPYAMLAGSLPANKLGVYMGIFNFFITIPQICNALLGPFMVRSVYGGESIYAMVFSGVCLLIASIAVLFVQDKDDPVLLKLRLKSIN